MSSVATAAAEMEAAKAEAAELIRAELAEKLSKSAAELQDARAKAVEARIDLAELTDKAQEAEASKQALMQASIEEYGRLSDELSREREQAAASEAALTEGDAQLIETRALLSASRDELARVRAGMSADTYEKLARAPRSVRVRLAIFFGLAMAAVAVVWLLAVWLAASARFSDAVSSCDAPAVPAPARTFMGVLKMAATRVGALKPEVVLLPPSDQERYMCILRKASVVLP